MTSKEKISTMDNITTPIVVLENIEENSNRIIQFNSSTELASSSVSNETKYVVENSAEVKIQRTESGSTGVVITDVSDLRLSSASLDEPIIHSNFIITEPRNDVESFSKEAFGSHGVIKLTQTSDGKALNSNSSFYEKVLSTSSSTSAQQTDLSSSSKNIDETSNKTFYLQMRDDKNSKAGLKMGTNYKKDTLDFIAHECKDSEERVPKRLSDITSPIGIETTSTSTKLDGKRLNLSDVKTDKNLSSIRTERTYITNKNTADNVISTSGKNVRKIKDSSKKDDKFKIIDKSTRTEDDNSELTNQDRAIFLSKNENLPSDLVQTMFTDSKTKKMYAIVKGELQHVNDEIFQSDEPHAWTETTYTTLDALGNIVSESFEKKENTTFDSKTLTNVRQETNQIADKLKTFKPSAILDKSKNRILLESKITNTIGDEDIVGFTETTYITTDAAGNIINEIVERVANSSAQPMNETMTSTSTPSKQKDRRSESMYAIKDSSGGNILYTKDRTDVRATIDQSEDSSIGTLSTQVTERQDYEISTKSEETFNKSTYLSDISEKQYSADKNIKHRELTKTIDNQKDIENIKNPKTKVVMIDDPIRPGKMIRKVVQLKQKDDLIHNKTVKVHQENTTDKKIEIKNEITEQVNTSLIKSCDSSNTVTDNEESVRIYSGVGNKFHDILPQNIVSNIEKDNYKDGIKSMHTTIEDDSHSEIIASTQTSAYHKISNLTTFDTTDSHVTSSNNENLVFEGSSSITDVSVNELSFVDNNARNLDVSSLKSDEYSVSSFLYFQI